MGLESSFNYIDDLDDTNPAAGDNISQGDNHLRGIKEAVQGSFPNLGSAAVTSTAAELNVTDGVTSFLDEDDMASDSATSIASQQSIKAYVDNKLAVTSLTVVEIGDWNMDADPTKSVTHGLTDHKKVRSVNVIIRDDNDSFYHDLKYAATADASAAYIQIGATTCVLARPTSGFFDQSGYDSTSYNRGWITFITAD